MYNCWCKRWEDIAKGVDGWHNYLQVHMRDYKYPRTQPRQQQHQFVKLSSYKPLRQHAALPRMLHTKKQCTIVDGFLSNCCIAISIETAIELA